MTKDETRDWLKNKAKETAHKHFFSKVCRAEANFYDLLESCVEEEEFLKSSRIIFDIGHFGIETSKEIFAEAYLNEIRQLEIEEETKEDAYNAFELAEKVSDIRKSYERLIEKETNETRKNILITLMADLHKEYQEYEKIDARDSVWDPVSF